MADKLERDYPIPVPPDQFDQKNEVFKRARWDQEIISWARPSHENVKYEDRTGYRRHDCALRMGAWNLAHDTFQPFGVKKFCDICMKCAQHCPSRAISFDAPTTQGVSISNHSGVLKWYVNPGKCCRFWAENRMDCTTCINVCPFNKPRGVLHDSVRTVIRTVPVLNRMIAKADDLLGYGKPKLTKEFWNASP